MKPVQKEVSEVEALKFKVEQLFVYYCDYSLEKGDIFIKHSNMVKMMKDSRILSLENAEVIDQHQLMLMASKEINNPIIKSMDFPSFLNLLVKVAYTLFKRESQPKACLSRLLNEHLLPLLQEIEESIQNN